MGDASAAAPAARPLHDPAVPEARARGHPNPRREGRNGVKVRQLLALEPKTWIVVFETDDEVVRGLTAFSSAHAIAAAHLTAIGAFRGATLGYFDWQSRQYRKIPVHEQVEVLSLVGDIALREGSPSLHAHVVLGRADGTALGGHLLDARVRPTLEVTVVESPTPLRREYDPVSGLALIQP
jgi:predicted DNA-binding protein with PD1-like motif